VSSVPSGSDPPSAPLQIACPTKQLAAYCAPSRSSPCSGHRNRSEATHDPASQHSCSLVQPNVLRDRPARVCARCPNLR